MLAKPHLPIAFGCVGMAIGVALTSFYAHHNWDTQRIAILIFGEALTAIAPATVFVWSLQRRGRLNIHSPEWIAIACVIVGALGATRTRSNGNWEIADVFIALLWGSLASLIALTIWRRRTRVTQNAAQT